MYPQRSVRETDDVVRPITLSGDVAGSSTSLQTLQIASRQMRSGSCS